MHMFMKTQFYIYWKSPHLGNGAESDKNVLSHVRVSFSAERRVILQTVPNRPQSSRPDTLASISKSTILLSLYLTKPSFAIGGPNIRQDECHHACAFAHRRRNFSDWQYSPVSECKSSISVRIYFSPLIPMSMLSKLPLFQSFAYVQSSGIKRHNQGN